mmetsp:Transcript_58565/g.188211  ORF Transcript_58565/g.188211 Transcript_58565/m.188211 type:complete len:219 (-) Transcript_58565:87-743(-)
MAPRSASEATEAGPTTRPPRQTCWPPSCTSPFSLRLLASRLLASASRSAAVASGTSTSPLPRTTLCKARRPSAVGVRRSSSSTSWPMTSKRFSTTSVRISGSSSLPSQRALPLQTLPICWVWKASPRRKPVLVSSTVRPATTVVVAMEICSPLTWMSRLRFMRLAKARATAGTLSASRISSMPSTSALVHLPAMALDGAASPRTPGTCASRASVRRAT